MMVEHPVSDAVNAMMPADQLEVGLETDEKIEKILDEITWQPISDLIHEHASSSRISAAFLFHPGNTFHCHYRGSQPYGNGDLTYGKKQAVRTETCMALRFFISMLDDDHVQSTFRFADPCCPGQLHQSYGTSRVQ